MESKTCVHIFVCFIAVSSALAASVDRSAGQKCPEDLWTKSVMPLLQSISAELQELRQLKKTLETMAPFILSLPPVTNNISSGLQPVPEPTTPKTSSILSNNPEDCPSIPDAAIFSTAPQYVDTKLVTSLTNVLDHVKFSQSTVSMDCARIQCSEACSAIKSCHAFNFFESDGNYVCEFVPDNLCRRNSKLAFVNWPGGNVWEKKASADSPSCLNTKLGTGSEISCEVLRPGCLGVWPNCHSCVQNCKECAKRYLPPFGGGECTFWPYDYVPKSPPIFGYCSSWFTYLARRKIDPSTGNTTENFFLSVRDMYRLYQTKNYSQILFWFDGPNDTSHWYTYNNWAIDEHGTLSNLTFVRVSNAEGDIFNLNRTALKPTPFITVEKDVSGCGSFWLLNPDGDKDCPGGEVGMFGKTISSPQSRKDKKTLIGASIMIGRKPREDPSDPLVQLLKSLSL